MEEDIAKKLGELTLPELKILRQAATKKITAIKRTKNLHILVYIQAEYREAFEEALDWAWTNGLIKKKTRWSFTKFAVLNTVNLIMEEIQKQQKQKIIQNRPLDVETSNHQIN